MTTNNVTNNATPNVSAHAVLLSQGASNVTGVTLTTGQALMGVTGSDPVGTTLTIAQWADVSGTTQAAAVNTGYVISNASQTTVTLPVTADQGSVVAVQGKGAAGWILTAGTGQTIKFGSSTTTTAGSLTSTNLYDSVSLVCIAANTTWAVTSAVGNLTVS